ncbi:hypothetical protein TWF481_006573 [Arthrobotrys musiformis]|uniref:Phosphatidylserine decarboxylase n=1 Tax=Arthrobotrys musiformis TaxID=47236 RepID=A0AAV9W8X1_9PEZI
MRRLLAFVHSYVSNLLDEVLGWCNLIQNREVGWPTVDRKTRKLKREQQPILQKLKLIALFSPLIEWVDRTKIMGLCLRDNSTKEGKRERTPRSKIGIRPFIEFYHINMEEFTPSDIKEYNTFEDFLTREHARGSRPIFEEDDDSRAVVPSDCRVVVYPSVHPAQKFWIGGQYFSITNLLGDPSVTKSFGDVPIASFHLGPQDCHRYHSPVTGTVRWYKQFSGDYYNLDPWGLRSRVDVLTSNARCAVRLETEKYGDVMFVAIGASEVGAVNFYEEATEIGQKIHKGQEIGKFEFGGSSILVLFQRGRIVFDEDLLDLSNERIMVDVQVGMSLGRLQEKREKKRGKPEEQAQVYEKREVEVNVDKRSDSEKDEIHVPPAAKKKTKVLRIP